MPNDYLSDAIKEAYATAPGVLIYETVEIYHPSFVDPGDGSPAPIRVVNDQRSLTAWLEATAPLNPGEEVLFNAYPFQFQKPDMDPQSLPQVELVIDNISGEIVQNIEIAMQYPEKIWLIYRPYVETDLTVPHINPPMWLWITNINADLFTINIRATYGDIFNKSFPSELYTVERFPGLIGS